MNSLTFLKLSRIISVFVIFSLSFSCNTDKKPIELETGIWHGVLTVQGSELPFNFEVNKSKDGYRFFLKNAEERLELDDIEIKGDSISIPMHIFDADIKAVFTSTSMSGTWTKNYEEDYVLRFKAEHGITHRFKPVKNSTANFNGKWDVTFNHEGDTTIAIAVFKQNGNDVTGTFLTPTGDYRYLEGTVDGNNMSLSTFDGGHAFLFKAILEDGKLSGDFWSGKKWHETWVGMKNDSATLPDADSLTFIKEGYDKLAFSFPDLEGKMVSLDDYKGKPVILQVFGTWCPNCMDETKFLNNWYEENKSRGIEILGLAYEAKDDYKYARDRVKKMKDKWNISYDYVIAGHHDKKEAAKTLPMLNHILSFPTTIFIDREGNVKRIHTGFTGPGTGPYYEQFVKEFNETVDELLE